MSTTLLRQWAMLRAIPRQPRRASTREIWQRVRDDGYGVRKRTVERDLATLSGPFSFTSENEGQTTYWFWPRGSAGLDVPSLDPALAIALIMVRDYLRPLLPPMTLQALAPWLAQAEAVLDGQSDHGLGHWRRCVHALPRGPVMGTPEIDPAVHAAVSEALLHGKRLRADYLRFETRTLETLELSPLGLVARDGVVWLIAATDGPVARYALHRLRSAAVLDRPAHGGGPDLDSLIRQACAC